MSMQSFEVAYRQHRDAVLRFAMHCVGRREIAEELTAEAFLALYRNWQSIDATLLPAWLLTVVRNRAADHWRRLAMERSYLESEPPPPRPQAPAMGTGLFENKALKPVHRICLTLRYVHEMTVLEIAARLGLSEMQVKGHLQYARGLLRKQLSTEPGR